MGNPGVYCQAHFDSLLGVADLFVGDEFGGQKGEAVVVETAFHADGLTGTIVQIEMTPNFGQFGEGIAQAKRTLPQTRFVVTDRIRLREGKV